VKVIESWEFRAPGYVWAARARAAVPVAAFVMMAAYVLVIVAITAAETQPEPMARLAARLFPAESPCGRALAVYLLDCELDRDLVAYRLCDAERGRIAAQVRKDTPRDEAPYRELVQRDIYCGALADRISSRLAERCSLAVRAGIAHRVVTDVDFAGVKCHGR
jgi:hypothetical protein